MYYILFPPYKMFICLHGVYSPKYIYSKVGYLVLLSDITAMIIDDSKGAVFPIPFRTIT